VRGLIATSIIYSVILCGGQRYTRLNKKETMKKEYLFWREVRKSVREECCIEANSIEEATEIHNDGGADYEEVDCFFDEIIDEGTDEIPLTKKEVA
jgi:hypothetical protein